MLFLHDLQFQDTRIDGGYEAVPTRDIHMRQIGLQEEWLDFLENYVQPLQEVAYTGYASEVGVLHVFLFTKTRARLDRHVFVLIPARLRARFITLTGTFYFAHFISASSCHYEFHGQIQTRRATKPPSSP